MAHEAWEALEALGGKRMPCYYWNPDRIRVVDSPTARAYLRKRLPDDLDKLVAHLNAGDAL